MMADVYFLHDTFFLQREKQTKKKQNPQIRAIILRKHIVY